MVGLFLAFLGCNGGEGSDDDDTATGGDDDTTAGDDDDTATGDDDSSAGDDDTGPREYNIFPKELGDPIEGLDDEQLAQFDRGKTVLERLFAPSDGLGPSFNGVSCESCHFFPVSGGAANRHRDIFLLQGPGSGDTMTDTGTLGEGPLRKLYTLGSGHVPPGATTTVAARRAPLSGLGVGLFSLVPDSEILARADPDDEDQDGISGRAHMIDGDVGRFGYKAQSATVEHLVRSAFKDQMGLTTPEVNFVPKELAEAGSLQREPRPLGPSFPGVTPSDVLHWWLGTAHAHPSNPDEDPSTDNDAIPDPEISATDLEDLIVFVTYLAPPPPSNDQEPGAVERGEALFGTTGCARCHTPSLGSPVGRIPGYTDLLLHDMGDNLGEDVAVGDATETEFRTTPLWGARLHVPYLHDNSAPAIEFSMHGHGGEAAASAAAYSALTDEQEADLQVFLFQLGGWSPKGRYLAPEGTPVPDPLTPGGPDRELTPWERELWIAGRGKVDRMTAPNFNSGLGTHFNSDSCRSCHDIPVLGGGGRIDMNVILFDGLPDPDGEGNPGTYPEPMAAGTMPRSVVTRHIPWRMSASSTAVELRNAPSLQGLGLLNRIPATDILANADPNDANTDGISGRAHILLTGRLGRFGWKAQVPSVLDFVADANLNELGITMPTRFSTYTVAQDNDWFDDPEVDDRSLLEEAFYLEHVAAPLRKEGSDSADALAGEALFASFGCSTCHLPDLGGVAAYTDLLLHQVAPASAFLVHRNANAAHDEFRTPPLWGISDTGPFLHDGSAETLDNAIRDGHDHEAEAARLAYEGASTADQGQLITFLETL